MLIKSDLFFQHLEPLCHFFSTNSIDIFDDNRHAFVIYSYEPSTSSTVIIPFLALSFMVYLVGMAGMILCFRNFFIAMLATELMYSGIIVSFFFVGGEGYSEFSACGLLLLVVAASESAVGLSILIVLYRFGNSIKISDYQELRSSYSKPIITLCGLSFNGFSLEMYNTNFYFQNYVFIFATLNLAFLLCVVLVIISYFLALATSFESEKMSEYECGFSPFDSATRLPFDIHFYLVGVLFLIFDVEIALILPWASALIFMNWFSFYLVLFFIIILALGFVYEWKQGVLSWNKREIFFINND